MRDTAGLDGLLGPDEAHATFHDAELVCVAVDYLKRELVAEWHLCVGDPDASRRDARERRRDGSLSLEGLQFWVVEPPGAGVGQEGGLPWLTADGPLRQAPTDAGQRLAGLLPSGGVGWYLFFSDWNSYAYCGAAAARFQWK